MMMIIIIIIIIIIMMLQVLKTMIPEGFRQRGPPTPWAGLSSHLQHHDNDDDDGDDDR